MRIVTLVAAVTLANVMPAIAQDVTPTPVPLLVPEIEGVQDAAIRSFSATGFDPTGMISVAMEVIRFDSDDHAHDSLDTLTERQFSRLGQNGDTSGIQEASVDEIGDETRAFAGDWEISDTTSPITSIVAGLVIARNGEFVFVTLAGSLAGNAVGAASEVTKAVIDREPGDESTPEADNGMREGGLWEMLPTLEDVPSGLVFDEDRVPVPFEPLPGQSDAPAETNAETQTDASGDAVAFNESGIVGENWSVQVLEVIEDPYQIDPSATWFSDWLDANPPGEGQQYVTLRVRVTNTGAEAGDPAFDLNMDLIGSQGYEYRSDMSGVPGGLSFMTQLRPDESIEFNVAWIVDVRDIDVLMLSVSAGFGDDPVLFALR